MFTKLTKISLVNKYEMPGLYKAIKISVESTYPQCQSTMKT